MNDESSIELLQRWKDGDENAASQLFERYVNRLCSLARTRLSQRMQRRVEPEDVVQSAFRSFFREAGNDRYALESSGDLWKLLAAITINKIHGQVEFHTAQKRGIYAEESFAGTASTLGLRPQALAEEPTPSDAAAVIEELQNVLKGLDPLRRQILELALQNKDENEISETVQRSGRTVRRTLAEIRENLQARLA